MDTIKIKGHVKIFDESNNLVVEVDNMVVESGRLAIRNAFLSGRKCTFKEIILGSNGSITEPTMTLESVNSTKLGESFEISEQPENNNDINEPIELKLTFETASYEQYSNIKELSLVITVDSVDSLFSRVVFPGYPFTKDHTYTMHYYIYF